jgi:hypothetical protein
MDLADLEWEKMKPEVYGGVKVNQWIASVPKVDAPDCPAAYGVDPGRNFGLTLYLPHTGDLITYGGKLPAGDYPMEAQSFINDFVGNGPKIWVNDSVLIEGASYGDKYGQVLLEGIRMAFELAFKNLGFMNVKRIAPNSARKIVLGSGKETGKAIWPTINPNAADSVVIALAAGGYQHVG